MPTTNRLVPLVKLREQEEDRARRDLAEAQRRTTAASERLRLAVAQARTDTRARGSSVDWEIAEVAQVAALREVRQAESAARVAADHLSRKQTDFVGVHGKAEAVRRIVRKRTEEATREAEAGERKTLDEMAVLRHGRRRSPTMPPGHTR